MKKRVLTVLLAGVLAAAALTGCGGSGDGEDSGTDKRKRIAFSVHLPYNHKREPFLIRKGT